jgi:hypothetical protein
MASLSFAVLDWLLLPGTLLAAIVLKAVRRIGLSRLVQNRRALSWVGVLPIRRHYYEPLVHPEDLRRPLELERELPGIDWNVSGQLEFLRGLRYAGELQDLTAPSVGGAEFRLNNGSFESGDAEFLYQLIRAKKPRRIIEVGCGQSTLIARRATRRNQEEVAGYDCRHTCIEPFEAPWLETLGVEVIRKRVEDVDAALFVELAADDLLFIDSSHIIRPQGDVVTEYLELLPSLRPGVIVHVHDVFSPRDYPREWVIEQAWLWNEQYLLESFLTHNECWRVLAALNMLRHHHFDELRLVCPYLTDRREPGSFYIQRVK